MGKPYISKEWMIIVISSSAFSVYLPSNSSISLLIFSLFVSLQVQVFRGGVDDSSHVVSEQLHFLPA